jgi:hypothetical protein
VTVYSDSRVTRSLLVLGSLTVLAVAACLIGGAAIIRNCNRLDDDDE